MCIRDSGGEGRWLIRVIPRGVNYIGAVLSCCSLVPMRPSSFAFSFPVAFLSYARPRASRSSSRHAVSLAVSFRAFRCVVSSVVSSHRLGSSHRLVSSRRLVWRRSALLFARSRFVCRGGFALRFRAVSFCFGIPFVLSSRCSSRLSSCLSSRLVHLVSSCHLVLRLPVGGSCPFSCLVPVFAPFRPAIRSFLFVHQFRFLCLRRGAWRGVMAMMAAEVCSCRLIRPLIVPARYSLTRCGMATGMGGY